MRMTPKEAIARGLIPRGSNILSTNKSVSRREGIADRIKRIEESKCDVAISGDGKKALVRIQGISVPSWNEVLRYDLKREFYTYNKKWRALIANASMVTRPRTLSVEKSEVVKIHVHTLRKRLLDPDNICVKMLVDAVAKNSFIPDDNPIYVGKVSSSQEKSTIEAIYIDMKVVERCSEKWIVDQLLIDRMAD